MKRRTDEDETGFPERPGINPTPDEPTGNPPTPHPAHTGIDPGLADGGGLFAFTTTYDRPAFWAVRGDSSWLEDDGTDITEFVDTITENLRREFGDAEPESDDEESPEADEADRYPAIDLRDGYSWRQLERVDDPDTGQQRNPAAAGGADQEAAAAPVQHIP